jgi:hypothetical protein
MEFLTPAQCQIWLLSNGIEPAPYGRPSRANHAEFIQFAARTPRDPSCVDGMFASFGRFDGCLIEFLDWHWDWENPVDPSAALRRAHAESRTLFEVPGVALAADESATAAELSRQAVATGCTAYLYLLANTGTVLFWEGELIDFWSSDAKVVKRVERMINHAQYRRISSVG